MDNFPRTGRASVKRLPHLGSHDRETIYRILDEWWGKKVSLDFTLFETEEMKGYLKAVGFELEEVIERDPYPDIEVPTRRAYIFARNP